MLSAKEFSSFKTKTRFSYFSRVCGWDNKNDIVTTSKLKQLIATVFLQFFGTLSGFRQLYYSNLLTNQEKF